MAAATVLPTSEQIKPPFTPIIVQPKLKVAKCDFDPKRHLEFKDPSKVYTMRDLGLPEDQGISPVAVSEPFHLFSEEAVMRMREEVLSTEVWKNCQYSSNLSPCMLRGFANKYAPFVYDAWKSPETLAIISKVAKIDLIPVMDFEIGHINISVKSGKDKEEEIKALAERAHYAADEGISDCPWEDDTPVFDWHTDAYPFVCVTMLSDCSTMVGGETALRTGTGEIMKVRGPQMGCAVILQGRYIEHQALRTLGMTERISMVTSFRPRSARMPDDTVLTTVRPISDLGELYHQFAEYRLEILEERVRQQLRELRDCKSSTRAAADSNAKCDSGGRRRHIPTRRLKAFFAEQERFLAHMNREMIEDEYVIMGSVDDSHLLTKKGKDQESEEEKKLKRQRSA